MKGRKRTPTNLKIITGNPGKRALPKNEPQPDSEMPAHPSHLDKYAREEWDRLCPSLHTLGLLYAVDRGAFACYCMAYSRWRTAEEELSKRVEKGGTLAGLIDVTGTGSVIQNPLVGIANKAMADMIRYAAEFGLSPASRARLGTNPGREEKDEFEGLIGRDGTKKH